MKKVITFFIASLFVGSLAGQNVTNKSGGSKTRIQINSTGHFNKSGIGERQELYKWIINRESAIPFLKSTSENKQMLDSTISEQFNESAGVWQTQYKNENNYYENGKLKDQSRFGWVVDNGTGMWQDIDKYEFVYDSKGNLIQHIKHGWNYSTGLWGKRWKLEYSYDNNGNLIQWINFPWDDDNSQWNKLSKIEYNYNENNHRTLETSYMWDDDIDQWVINDKTEYTYDNTDKLTLRTEYNWQESQWTEKYKNEYTYDDDGLPATIISSDWNENQWENEYKEEFAFNADGNLILKINYEWEEQWTKDSKEEYIFAGNGNLDEEIFYSWNKSENVWVERYKNEHTYNDSFAYNNLILPVIYSQYSYYGGTYWWEICNNHMLLSSISFIWEEDAGNWKEKDRTTSYYSETEITGITETADFNLIIYPNPVVEEFRVRSLDFKDSGATLEIFNLNGIKLLEKQIPAGSEEITVDVHSLHSGLYFCRLTVGNQSATKKLIIQK
jgi:hypothetical protein